MTLPPFVTAWALRAALWGAVAAAGAVAWQHTPVIGPSAVQRALREDLGETRRDRDDWHRASDAWTSAFRASERARGRETQAAREAVEAGAQACDARVSEARRSSAAIRNLVTKEPARDQNGCAVRATVGATELRDALQGSAR